MKLKLFLPEPQPMHFTPNNMNLKHLFLLCFILGKTFNTIAQIPILNSKPQITDKVLYLDFDGQVVSGTAWNSGNTINAAPSTVSNANKILIFKRIAEDYVPFGVNITTDSSRFNNALPNRRMRIVFTPTSAWFGSAGGVAYVGSFAWGGTPGTPCWVFENQLGYNSKNMAEAAAHEAGHTLSLRHQSTYDVNCNKTNEYHPGQGTGVTSWAPIMGVGYSKNVTIWHNGKSATSCTLTQLDHSNGSVGITGNAFLNFENDDVGDNLTNAKWLNLNTLTTQDSGLITTPSDIDVYRFSICGPRYVSINAKPWALDTSVTGYNGANLDIKLKLYNAITNSLIAADSSLTKLNALCGLNLTAGSYYFTIDGAGSNNYSDYGSLGRYYLSVKATNPPPISAQIQSNNSYCLGQNAQLSASAIGTPTAWLWTISAPISQTLTSPNPSFNCSTAGIYTITLLVNGSGTNCPVTRTIAISPVPTLAISGIQNALCAPATRTLLASGATNYTWYPGSYTGSFIIVSPSVNTQYTLMGAIGNCSQTTIQTLSVNPSFTPLVSANLNSICPGTSVSLTATGALNYTFYPGGITANPAVFSPTFNTNYTVVASDGTCIKSTYKLIQVASPWNFNLSISDTIACNGGTVMITDFGSNAITIQPGNYSGIQIPLIIYQTQTYTISGIGPSNCLADTLLNIYVDKSCDVSSINEFNTNNLIRIFPNPSSGSFNIVTYQAVELELFSYTGNLLWHTDLNQNQSHILRVNNAAGIYFLKIKTREGAWVVHRLIKT